jgi:hypothetical protein
MQEPVSLAYPGFRPEIEKVKLIEGELEKQNLAGSDMVVLDLISNVSHMGTNDEWLPTPAFRGGGGWQLPCQWFTNNGTPYVDQKSSVEL